MKFVQSMCSFIASILGIYSTVLIIRIIISWFRVLNGRNGWRTSDQQPSALENIDTILGKICDPYLNLFRGAKGLRRGNMDFTPLLAFVVLNLVRSILSLIGEATSFTLWTILAIIVNGLWSSMFSFLLILLIILLIVRLVIGNSRNPSSNNWINTIDPLIDSPVSFIYRLFYNKRKVDDQKVVITALIFYVVLYIGLSWGVKALINLLLSL
ncbi:MAG: YggT family protein [Spirochaetales bacterium]|nr:YggT family protein [Spirochaetales bacterium]